MTDEPEQRESPSELSPKTPSSHRRGIIYAIVLVVTFVSLSIGFTLYAFPELSFGRAMLAGVFFGGFLSLCSITYSIF